jgi:hypothetical protein
VLALASMGRPRPPPAFAARTHAWRRPAQPSPDHFVVGHVDLDTQSGAVRSLNLDHLEAVEHREDIVV